MPTIRHGSTLTRRAHRTSAITQQVNGLDRAANLRALVVLLTV